MALNMESTLSHGAPRTLNPREPQSGRRFPHARHGSYHCFSATSTQTYRAVPVPSLFDRHGTLLQPIEVWNHEYYCESGRSRYRISAGSITSPDHVKSSTVAVDCLEADCCAFWFGM